MSRGQCGFSQVGSRPWSLRGVVEQSTPSRPDKNSGSEQVRPSPGLWPGGGARNGGQRVFTPRQIPPDAAAVVIQQSGTTNTGQTDGGENAGRFCP